MAKKKNANEMSFLNHLEDLRWLLVRSSAAIILMAFVMYFFSSFIFDEIIFAPMDDVRPDSMLLGPRPWADGGE
jgi:sec-independent protein translocase protein TatC